jgi:hypothetical protein
MPKLKKYPPIPIENLIDLADAPDFFGRGFSRRNILRRIDSGEFKEGLHFINTAPPGSLKAQIKLNKSAIEEYFSTPHAAR